MRARSSGLGVAIAGLTLLATGPAQASVTARPLVPTTTGPVAATTAAEGIAPGARLATANLTTGCGARGTECEIFGVHNDGTLWAQRSDRVADGCTVAWDKPKQWGTGWGGFQQLFADHLTQPNQPGQPFEDIFTLYALDQAGNLHWYGYEAAPGGGWMPGSGGVIATGFNNVHQLTSAGDGVFYGVNDAGNLLWYRYLDPFGGAPGWADGGIGQTIGTGGWQNFTRLFSSNGAIYAVTPSGDLLRYVYSDPTTPTGSFFSSGRHIGHGWDSLVAVDAVTSSSDYVVIHAVDPQGNLLSYFDYDPTDKYGSPIDGSGTVIPGQNWLS